MMVRVRSHVGTLLLAAFFLFAAPAAGRADNLFRFFPELELTGIYGDNIPLRSNNGIGDFAGTGALGFYLDYTSPARFASLHYDTFAQLFAHQTRFDRAGQGQFVHAEDDEKLSHNTRLRLDEIYYRNTPTELNIIAGNEAPQFNTLAAELLLASAQASLNRFVAELTHGWGHNWSSDLSVHQTTLFGNSSNSGNSNSSNTSFYQGVSTGTDYHFSGTFSLGAGYRFYDFRFTAPGQPGEQAHWPFARVTWSPMDNVYFSGMVGVVVSYTQGTSGSQVNPAGLASLQYNFRHGHFEVYGGQQPELNADFGGAGELQEVRGAVVYDFTQRLSGTAGGGYYTTSGAGVDAQLATWGFGLSDRVDKWVSVFAQFVEIRRTITGQSQFIPSGSESGKEATGNYFMVGFNASVEAFRWSWQ